MNEEVEQIELSMEQAKKAIAQMKNLDKLNNYKPFKELILDGFFEENPIRLVMLKADPGMQTKENQENIEREMFAIGHFRQYLRNIYHFGRIAEKTLKDDEKTHAELLAGE